MATVFAGRNCKCQDRRGQNNGNTRDCCSRQRGWNVNVRYPGPNNQCTSYINGIDSGAFVRCCQSYGIGGAFCW